MRILMSKEIYNELTRRCSKNRVELSGTLTVEQNKSDILIKEIWTDINCIKSNDNKSITYDGNQYIKKTIKEMVYNHIHVSYHTHPGLLGLPQLSDADKSHVRDRSIIGELVSEQYNLPSLVIIEGIVTDIEIAFYLYEERNDKFTHIPLFIDGKEMIPYYEKIETKKQKGGKKWIK